MTRAIRRNPLGDPSFFCGCEDCNLCFTLVEDQSVDDGMKVIAADLLGVPVEQVTPMQVETVKEGLMAAHAAIRASRAAAVEEYDEKQQVARVAIQASAVIVSAVQARVPVPKFVPTVVLDNVDLTPVVEEIEREKIRAVNRAKDEIWQRSKAEIARQQQAEREMVAASPYSIDPYKMKTQPYATPNWNPSLDFTRELERAAREYQRKMGK